MSVTEEIGVALRRMRGQSVEAASGYTRVADYRGAMIGRA